MEISLTRSSQRSKFKVHLQQFRSVLVVLNKIEFMKIELERVAPSDSITLTSVMFTHLSDLLQPKIVHILKTISIISINIYLLLFTI